MLLFVIRMYRVENLASSKAWDKNTWKRIGYICEKHSTKNPTRHS